MGLYLNSVIMQFITEVFHRIRFSSFKIKKVTVSPFDVKNAHKYAWVLVIDY